MAEFPDQSIGNAIIAAKHFKEPVTMSSSNTNIVVNADSNPEIIYREYNKKRQEQFQTTERWAERIIDAEARKR